MNTALKAKILDSFSNVKHEGFAGDCIRLMSDLRHEVTDEELTDAVDALQKQNVDHPLKVKRVLGDQYDFIINIKFEEPVTQDS